jgi:hypothetical protein
VVAWIGCCGKIAWPPQLPVLTPLDFSVWGYVKHKEFLPPLPGSLEVLWALITEAVVTRDAEIFIGFSMKSLADGTSAA